MTSTVKVPAPAAVQNPSKLPKATIVSGQAKAHVPAVQVF
jgi:hypothetical protein